MKRLREEIRLEKINEKKRKAEEKKKKTGGKKNQVEAEKRTKLLKNKSNGGNSKMMKEKTEPQEDDLEVIKNLKATDKLPHLMEDIPIPGLLTIYIDPEVRTSRVLQEALVDEKSRLDVKWIKSHDFTNDSFYGVTKYVLKTQIRR